MSCTNLPRLGTAHFLERRELGIVNIGGPARITVGGNACALDRLYALYPDLSSQRVGVTRATVNDQLISEHSPDAGQVRFEDNAALITINRRLAKDFERFANTVQTLIQIAMIKLMARRIARYRQF